MSLIKSRWYTVKSIWSRNGVYEKKSLLLIFLSLVFVYICYSVVVEDDEDFQKGYSETTPYDTENQKYLISTSKCRIPDIDPFNDEVRKFIVKEEYTKCTNLDLLTYIDKSEGAPLLRINASLLPFYSPLQIVCCYSNISRINYVNKTDNEITFSACKQFHDKTAIAHPFVRVTCSTTFSHVYVNTHATVIPPPQETTPSNSRSNRFSVLLVGIDSISKLNLRRTLPKTYSYLEENLINLKGYNKIGDNTFPNLMAILTGKNSAQLKANCSTKVKLNTCDIIWDRFNSSGYVTGYGEDEAKIATFYYDRPGFTSPPTTYYYRPYIIASEMLGRKLRYGMSYCAGPETSGERIFNLAKDFAIGFKDVPIFGLFWMNSFSHDNINLASSMDEKVAAFLGDTDFKSSLNHTFMVFFSDHGFRFGDIRYTHTGWLEERLPFIYLHVPHNFRLAFPEKFKNFMVNTERLTTPYDLFNTLEDVLKLGNPQYRVKPSLGCSKCQSLFEEIPEARTCKQAAIDQHWCTCTGHNYINPNDRLVRPVAQFVVDEINSLIGTFAESTSCAVYGLKKVVSAGMSEPYLNENGETVNYFLVIIETKPSAMFEATVEAFLRLERSYFKLLGDVSRIDRYAANSFCVKSAVLKKYCYCDGFLNVIKKFICPLFNC